MQGLLKEKRIYLLVKTIASEGMFCASAACGVIYGANFTLKVIRLKHNAAAVLFVMKTLAAYLLSTFAGNGVLFTNADPISTSSIKLLLSIQIQEVANITWVAVGVVLDTGEGDRVRVGVVHCVASLLGATRLFLVACV